MMALMRLENDSLRLGKERSVHRMEMWGKDGVILSG